MPYKRKRPEKFKYILTIVGHKFSWQIYLQTRRSDIQGIFEKDCEKWLDEKKVRLLLGKFGAAVYDKYVNFILLSPPGEVTFRETTQILRKIFGEQSSLFNTCWQCHNLTKKDYEDYTTFASTVNICCKKLQLNEITPDMFKCLIFIQGLAQKMPYLRAQRTQILTLQTWRGKLFKK